MSPKVTKEHKDKRQAEILEAAKTVFKRKGFELTTMKDVVEESGFSRGGVYLYFSSTEEMFRRIIETGLDEGLRKLALPHLQEGCAIINTTSITAYEGDTALIDYSSTKGAIVSFTRSMAKSLADKGIRVNAVAPGPIWTPLIPATFPEEKVKQHGLDTPMGRPGQPVEHAGAYVLLASDESSYMTGQTIHVNGGRFIST